MRRSQKEAAHTRETIVKAASDLIRQSGISEASIANVMAAAGLTHGGFYKHFKSQDQLVTEAIAAAGERSIGIIQDHLRSGGRAKVIASYLAKVQCDGTKIPACPLATTGSELSRTSPETRSTATKTVMAFIDVLAQSQGESDRDSRKKAIADVVTMVGALTLARLVADLSLSAEILDSAIERLSD